MSSSKNPAALQINTCQEFSQSFCKKVQWMQPGVHSTFQNPFPIFCKKSNHQQTLNHYQTFKFLSVFITYHVRQFCTVDIYQKKRKMCIRNLIRVLRKKNIQNKDLNFSVPFLETVRNPNENEMSFLAPFPLEILFVL